MIRTASRHYLPGASNTCPICDSLSTNHICTAYHECRCLIHQHRKCHEWACSPLSGRSYGPGVADSLGSDWLPCVTSLLSSITVRVIVIAAHCTSTSLLFVVDDHLVV